MVCVLCMRYNSEIKKKVKLSKLSLLLLILTDLDLFFFRDFLLLLLLLCLFTEALLFLFLNLTHLLLTFVLLGCTLIKSWSGAFAIEIWGSFFRRTAAIHNNLWIDFRTSIVSWKCVTCMFDITLADLSGFLGSLELHKHLIHILFFFLLFAHIDIRPIEQFFSKSSEENEEKAQKVELRHTHRKKE